MAQQGGLDTGKMVCLGNLWHSGVQVQSFVEKCCKYRKHSPEKYLH